MKTFNVVMGTILILASFGIPLMMVFRDIELTYSMGYLSGVMLIIGLFILGSEK